MKASDLCEAADMRCDIRGFWDQCMYIDMPLVLSHFWEDFQHQFERKINSQVIRITFLLDIAQQTLFPI